MLLLVYTYSIKFPSDWEVQIIPCLCGWEGTENELVVGFYESYESSMPIASNCPKCGVYLE